MPDVEQVLERAEGVATTEQVQVVSRSERMMLAPRAGAMLVTHNPITIGSISVISTSSSPWWTTRLVEHMAADDVHHLDSGAIAGAVPVSMAESMVEAPSGALGGWESRGHSAHRWGLDLGLDITLALSAELATRLMQRAFETTWRQVQMAWLIADPPQAIAAARPVPDDAEWDESDDSPRWLSLADLSYRGGGVMHRRASPSRR